MRFACILQHSEEDCGAACLASVTKHYGRVVPLNRVREAVGTGQLGSSLLGLKRGAEVLGYDARMIKTAPEILNRLDEVPLPAIIHWYGIHWVTLYGRKGNKYIIADPALGIRYLSKEQLIEGWMDWVLLLLEPDSTRFFEQEMEPVSGFWRFLRQVVPYRDLLVQAFGYALIIGLLSLSSPLLIQVLTDDVLVRGDSKMLVTVAIAVIVMSCVRNALSYVQSHIVAHFAQRLELGFILQFARTILRLPLSYFEARRSGEIISRQQDIQEINQLIAQVVIGLPVQFVIAGISYGLMVFYSWKLTIASMALAFTMTLSTFIFLPILQRKVRELLALDAQNQGLLVETFKGALVFKTTTAEPQLWEELQMRFRRIANRTFDVTRLGILNSTFSRLVGDVSSVVMLWVGSSLVINRELSMGQLLAFNSMNGNFLGLISTCVGLLTSFVRVKAAMQRLGEVIDATPEITTEDLQKPYVKLSDRADITCHNLNFHYAGRADLLKEFSLRVPGGRTIAFIGKSGCGKSSLAKLIAGLYEFQEGNLQIGAYNTKDIALDCLRKQVSLVPQEPHFWSRSILDNFRMGNPDISFEDVVAVCELADADEFISQLPDRYHTVLGEFGANLSVGQRQRLAIARALINDPPVLILDEATANLDPDGETRVLNRVLSHRKGRTTILISHHPRVIQRADWLVWLEKGKMRLEGPIEEVWMQTGELMDFLMKV